MSAAALQFTYLVDVACTSMAYLLSDIRARGPGCLELVQLLLEHGADPNVFTGASSGYLTPLLITSVWTGGEDTIGKSIYGCKVAQYGV